MKIKRFFFRKGKRATVLRAAVFAPIFLIIALILQAFFLNYSASNVASKYQSARANEHVNIKKGNKAYATGSNIPNVHQFKKWRSSPGKLYFRAYVAVPKQPGVPNAISSMQVNEGSDNNNLQNKAMTYGGVMAKRGQLLDSPGIVGIAAHNFGDNRTFFSPLQKIDPNSQPFIYVTDGAKIYKYRVNKGISSNENDVIKDHSNPKDIPGKRIVNYKHGNIIEDYNAHGHQVILLYSCYEHGVFNLNPKERVVVTGVLDNVKNATTSEKSIFPQIN